MKICLYICSSFKCVLSFSETTPYFSLFTQREMRLLRELREREILNHSRLVTRLLVYVFYVARVYLFRAPLIS